MATTLAISPAAARPGLRIHSTQARFSRKAPASRICAGPAVRVPGASNPCIAASFAAPRLAARKTDVKAQAAAVPAEPAPTSPDPEASATWKGANLKGAVIAIGIGLAIRFLIPIPVGLTVEGWTLLSIFVSTIVGLVIEPLPTGAWAMLGVTAAIVAKCLTFAQAFGAFSNEVIWLIVASFFFAKGLEKTGLGNRVAQVFVKAMGKSTMGLAYGLTIAETVICPAMPSSSARAGGIFMPIIKSLAEAAGSTPGKTADKMGSYLIHSQLQAANNSSNTFLTGSAQNLLCLKLAAELGAVVTNPWITWFVAASVPSLAGILIVPWLLYKVAPPELKDTPEAPAQAEKELQAMGPMSGDEKIMAATMLVAVSLWVGGDALGIPPVVAALLGLCSLLFTGVLKWKDCLTNTSAWDTLTWFAILIAMSGQLNAMGVIEHFAGAAGATLNSMSLGWPAVFGILHAVFFLIHYAFASQTAHVGALYSAFLAMMLAAGCPPVLAALSLAYSTNLNGGLAHYSSGQAAVFCGAGYLQIKEVFRVGAVFAVANAFIWGVVGMAWWKVIGLY